MHSVVKNLIARKNKKPPFSDGRKIALLNTGGSLSGARGMGVLSALQDLGLKNAFDQIYSISAGFPNTTFFLTGDCKKGLSLYESMLSNKLIDFFRFWNIEKSVMVVEAMKKSRSANISKLFKSPSELFVALQSLSDKKYKYFNVKELGQDKYYDVLKACISMPFFSRGSITLDEQKYKDFLKINYHEHLDYVMQQNITDLLVIYNNKRQNKIPALFSEKIFEIFPPREWKIGRLKEKTSALSREFEYMKNLTLNIFMKR